MSSLMTIHPYKHHGQWVFDDARVGLVREPFISGADTLIDRMVAGIPDAGSGFNLVFSAAPFPGSQIELEWVRSEHGGNWYYSAALQHEGWHCPALLKYFDVAPAKI